MSARSSSASGAAAAVTPDSKVRAAWSRWPDHSSTAPWPDSTRARIFGPGELPARDHAGQCLCPGGGGRGRGEVAGAAGGGEADHRGGQPARDLLIGGKTRQEAVGGSQRGGGRSVSASGQCGRGGDQVRRRSGPGPAVRHAPELAGQGRAAPRLDDLADRQRVDDDTGGELPVAGPGGVPHRVGELAVRSYHRAARRCKEAIRSGCSRLSLSRSTSASNGWYRYHPDPADWTNPLARAKAGKIAPAWSLPVSSQAAWALTRSRMDVLSRTSRTSGGWVLRTSATR